MAYQNFDAEDTVVLPILAFASAVLVDAGSFGLFDVTLSDQTTIAGATVSLAYVLSLGALGMVILTNENISVSPDGLDDIRSRIESRPDMADWYYYVVIGVLGVTIAWPFVPELYEFFSSQDLWKLVYIVGNTAAAAIIGWEM
jgi:hypothetical protein